MVLEFSTIDNFPQNVVRVRKEFNSMQKGGERKRSKGVSRDEGWKDNGGRVAFTQLEAALVYRRPHLKSQG